MKMTFDEKTNSYILTEDAPVAKAELESPGGFLKGITSFELGGIPVGAAAAGGAVAYVVDGLIDRFVPNVTGWMGNLLGAFVLVKFANKWIGNDVAKYASLFLVYEAVRDPIEGALSGVLGKAGMKAPRGNFHRPGVLEQAGAVASGYYDTALRRG